jgi:hypothetical protein
MLSTLSNWRRYCIRKGVIRTVFLTLLAEALGKLDQVDEALRTLSEAVTAVDESRQRLYDAELQRLNG